MARVSITVLDDVVARAKAVGLNVSSLTTAALFDLADQSQSLVMTYLGEQFKGHRMVKDEGQDPRV